jgi:hypothetical protein
MPVGPVEPVDPVDPDRPYFSITERTLFSIILGPAVLAEPDNPTDKDWLIELESALDNTAKPVGLVKKSGVTTVGAGPAVLVGAGPAVLPDASPTTVVGAAAGLNIEMILFQKPPPARVLRIGSDRFIVNDPLFRFFSTTFFSPSKYMRIFGM